MAEIAKVDMGSCASCSCRVEAGEWFSSEGGRIRHTGCLSWRGSGVKGTVDAPAQSGFLFSNSDEAVIEHAKEVLNVKSLSFDGVSSMQIDVPRLSLQLARVFELVKDGRHRTLRQIADATGCLETSASARLRDLRKSRFGGHTVLPHQLSASPLVYEYQLILNTAQESDGRRNAA